MNHIASRLPAAERISREAAEAERLEALADLDILDSPREEAFDRIARVAKTAFGVPMALISVIDGHRQWYKSCIGSSGTEAPRGDTFCTVTIAGERPMVVLDTAVDERFAANPYVLGPPFVRFYAGAPLQTSSGHNIGTLCIVDAEPRDQFGQDHVDMLVDLAHLAVEQLELRQLATFDTLTGAMSRKAFKDGAKREFALAVRHDQDLSCIAFDLDHFKSVNDKYGHGAGDDVLKAVVRTCAGQLRQTDSLGRLGGEEFAVLLPQTSAKGAADVAEKLRAAVERLRFSFDGEPAGVTASFGITSRQRGCPDFQTLLEQADIATYQAKLDGRNRVVAHRTPEQIQANQRRRVLKGGQVLFNGGYSTLDCTVRSLSDEGAGIDLFSTVSVPKKFELVIKADEFRRTCQVVERTDKHLEVEFR